MCLKNFSSVIDGHWNDGTATLGGYFEASFMEREQFCFVRTFASGSFWEDADGNAGFDFFNSCKDGFQSLLDIFAVKEKAVKITHPVGKKWIMFHFFFGDVAGSDRAAAVSQYDVKVAAVIADVKDRSIFWNIFFSRSR